MSYSSPGYLATSYLLEKFSGQPYEQHLATYLLRPLAMPEATAGPASRARPPNWPGAANATRNTVGLSPRYISTYAGPASVRDLKTTCSHLSDRTGLHAGYGLVNFALGLKDKALFRGYSAGIDGLITAFGYNRELGADCAFLDNGRVPTLRTTWYCRRGPFGHYRGAAPATSYSTSWITWQAVPVCAGRVIFCPVPRSSARPTPRTYRPAHLPPTRRAASQHCAHVR